MSTTVVAAVFLSIFTTIELIDNGKKRSVSKDDSTEQKQSSKKIVIDLCSGWQSMRPVCEKLGLDYIAVDIEGDRNVRAMIEKSIKS